MTVYLDLVIGLNFLVDFLLLIGTNRLAGFPPGWGECALAAAVGGIYAGACLLPGFSFLQNGIGRMASLVLMAGIAFGWNRTALRRGGIFLLLSMALGGLAMGFGRGGLWAVLPAAGVLWVLCRMWLCGGGGQQEYIPVELIREGKHKKLVALRDTGNTLRDPLTGEQVLVAGADVAAALLGLHSDQLRHPVELMASGKIPGLRLIPYHAIGQPGGMLAAVRFRGAKVGDTYADPLVAFAPDILAPSGAYQMLTGGTI